MDEVVEPVLSNLIARCETLRLQMIDFEKHIKHLSRTNRYNDACEELRKLRGVGLLTAMTFLTEMGDLTRFSNRRQVAAYLGLCPSSSERAAIQTTERGTLRVKVRAGFARCYARRPGRRSAWTRRCTNDGSESKAANRAGVRKPSWRSCVTWEL